MSVLVRERGERVHAFGEADPLLERFRDLLVVLAIRGRGIDALAVEQGHAAPAIDQRLKIRLLAARGRAPALVANRAPVPEELVEDLPTPRRRRSPRSSRLVALRAQALVALEHLLHLLRVIRHQLRRRIDRGQSAADDAGGQAHLQVRERRRLRGARELQRHQEIRRLADAAQQIVLDADDRRLAGARRDRDVIEAELPRVLDRQASRRSARRRSCGSSCRRASSK